jgi:hypothetical protein
MGRPHPSRRAHASVAFAARALPARPQDEGGACMPSRISYSRCQTAQSSSLPRRFPSAGSFSSLPLRVLRPEARGGGAPEAGHWHFRRACEARRLASRATGGRLAALQRGDFRPRDQRFMFRQCPPESAPRLRPRPGITPGRSGLAPPAAAVRSAPWDATSPLSPQGISGDAPHERGCGSIAWMRSVVNSCS